MKGWKTGVLALFLVSCLLACSSGEEPEPKNAQVSVDRGNSYLQKKDLKQAFSDFNQALELDPKYAWAYNSRGFVYILKGELDLAIKAFNLALELDPSLAFASGAPLQRAFCLLAAGPRRAEPWGVRSSCYRGVAARWTPATQPS